MQLHTVLSLQSLGIALPATLEEPSVCEPLREEFEQLGLRCLLTGSSVQFFQYPLSSIKLYYNLLTTISASIPCLLSPIHSFIHWSTPLFGMLDGAGPAAAIFWTH